LKGNLEMCYRAYTLAQVFTCKLRKSPFRNRTSSSRESFLSQTVSCLSCEWPVRNTWRYWPEIRRRNDYTRLHHDRVSVVCMFGDVVWLQIAGIFGLRGRSTVRAVRWRDRRALSHSYRENTSADWLRIT